MASSRRPTALGPGPVSGSSAASGGPRRPVGLGGDEEEERTTVDDGPPRKPAGADGWEERTVQDRGTPRPKRLGEPPVIDPADADSLVGTIDRGIDAETIEETTIDGGGQGNVQLLASGSNQVGLSTVDELTRDDGPRPAPRLAVVAAPADDEAEAAPTRVTINAKVVIIGGNDRGREFEISTASTSIGRGVDNDIVLTDIAVSRHHLAIEFDGGGFVARDLSSGNGTLVNNQRRAVTRLVTGDQLEIGNTLIRFECLQAVAQPVAPPIAGPTSLADDDEEVATIASRPPEPPARPELPLPAFAQRPVLNLQRSATTPGPVPIPGGVGPGFDPMSTMPVVRAPLSSINGVLIAPSAADRRRKLLIIAGAVACVAMLIVVAVAMSGGGEPIPIGESASKASSAKRAATAGEPRAERAVAKPAVAPTPEPTPAPAPEPEPAVQPAPEPEPEPEPAVEPAPKAHERTPSPPAAKKKPVTQRQPPKRAKKKPIARAKKKPAAPRVASSSSSKTVSAGQASAARKRASTSYKAKDFSAAAATLRSAAGSATGEAADELRSLADDYAAVGSNISAGNTSKSANPPAALAAYRKALAIDRRVGDGQHGSYIRLKLGEVAPKAAASFMAQRRYEAAKRACDSAVNYGAGSDPMVARVRKGLDKKAGEFYAQALKLRKTKPKQASSLLKRVLKIVPPDSRWYAKSYALLNSSQRKPRDDDE